MEHSPTKNADDDYDYDDFDIEASAAADAATAKVISKSSVEHSLTNDGSRQSRDQKRNKFKDIEAHSMVVHSKNSFKVLDDVDDVISVSNNNNDCCGDGCDGGD